MASGAIGPGRRRLGSLRLLAATLCFACGDSGADAWSSGPYLQEVTPTGATVARVFGEPRTMEVTLRDGEAEVRRVSDGARRHQRVRFDGLRPGTTYAYSVRSAEGNGREEGGRFTTPPREADARVEFLVLADTGELPWWFRTLGRHLPSNVSGALPRALHGRQWDVAHWIESNADFDFALHLGDVVYPERGVEYYPEAFFLPFGSMLSNTPLFAVAGNHDLESPSDPGFFRVFHLPRNAVDREEHSYAFGWGPVRVVAVDSVERRFPPGSALGAWVRDALCGAEERWKIVAIHHPLVGPEQDADWLHADLWPAVSSCGVALVLSGHAHSYQRFEAIDGVTQVVVPSAAKTPRPVRGDPRLLASGEFNGFARVTATANALVLEVLRTDGSLVDRLALE